MRIHRLFIAFQQSEDRCELVMPEPVMRREAEALRTLVAVFAVLGLLVGAANVYHHLPATRGWVWWAAAGVSISLLLSLPGMRRRAAARAQTGVLLRCFGGERVEGAPREAPPLWYDDRGRFSLVLPLHEEFNWIDLGEQRSMPDSDGHTRLVLVFVFFAYDTQHEGSTNKASQRRLVPVRIEHREETRARVVQMLEAIKTMHARRRERAANLRGPLVRGD